MNEDGPHADLVDAIERDNLPAEVDKPGHPRTFEHLRQMFVVRLGSWDRMAGQLLEQIAEDAGSIGRALSVLGVATHREIRAWTHSVEVGTEASVRWLAAQGRGRKAWLDARLRVVKLRRGDDYADLAESARSFRLRGEGDLSPAKLQPRYSIFLARSWLSMIGDLLGQVVADAGSYTRAAVVLAVREERLLRWIKWLIARGSDEAARADWPLASSDEIDATHPYADLAAAWLRGNLIGDDEIDVVPRSELRDFYRVPLGNWDDMIGNLLEQINMDAGSIRKASKAINMPRSTLSARLKRYRE